MTARRLVIVDDHAVFRARARELVQAAGWEVVGEAADAAAALAVVARLRPDAVLLDIQLPGPDGLSVCAQLHALGAAVVLISSRTAAEYGQRLPAASARGFIHKPDLSRARLAELLG